MHFFGINIDRTTKCSVLRYKPRQIQCSALRYRPRQKYLHSFYIFRPASIQFGPPLICWLSLSSLVQPQMCHFYCWLVCTADLMIHCISPHASTCSFRSALRAFFLGDFSTLEMPLNWTFTCPVLGKQRHQKGVCLSVWSSHVCAFSVVKERKKIHHQVSWTCCSNVLL